MKHSHLSQIMSTIMEHIPDVTTRQLIDIANTLDPLVDYKGEDITAMTDSQLLEALHSPENQPLIDRCNTLGKLGIILVGFIGLPILFLVHVIGTFYSATFNTQEDNQ